MTVSLGTTKGRDQSQPPTGPGLMRSTELIEQELATAEAALKIGNDGKARVCARRAVTIFVPRGEHCELRDVRITNIGHDKVT